MVLHKKTLYEVSFDEFYGGAMLNFNKALLYMKCLFRAFIDGAMVNFYMSE